MKVEGQTTGILEEKLKLEAEVDTLNYNHIYCIHIHVCMIMYIDYIGGHFEGATGEARK